MGDISGLLSKAEKFISKLSLPKQRPQPQIYSIVHHGKVQKLESQEHAGMQLGLITEPPANKGQPDFSREGLALLKRVEKDHFSVGPEAKKLEPASEDLSSVERQEIVDSSFSDDIVDEEEEAGFTTPKKARPQDLLAGISETIITVRKNKKDGVLTDKQMEELCEKWNIMMEELAHKQGAAAQIAPDEGDDFSDLPSLVVKPEVEAKIKRQELREKDREQIEKAFLEDALSPDTKKLVSSYLAKDLVKEGMALHKELQAELKKELEEVAIQISTITDPAVKKASAKKIGATAVEKAL
jgi:hypothetical protein